MPLNLGDVQTCEECGAKSEPLHDRGGRPLAEGGSLKSSWLNGPFPRHLEVGAGVRPILCPWCNDCAMGFPAIVNRPSAAKGEVWEVGGPRKKYFVPQWGAEAMKPRPDPYEPPGGWKGCKPQGQLSLFGGRT
jgi:hypothetical protein